MSYFCANSISIDKKNLSFKVKGGDNNVVPRSNCWSSYFKISGLIREISGGMIQFTTRTDKNIAIENLAYMYNNKMIELTGISAYDVGDLDVNPKDKLRIYKNIPNLADHWNKEVLEKIIAILKNKEMLEAIIKLKEEFVQAVINLKIDRKTKYFIYNKNHGAYVSKNTKKGIYMTISKQFAKQFTLLKAKDILSSYDKDAYEIRPIKVRRK